MNEEPEKWILFLFLRGGGNLDLKMAKTELLSITERWSEFRRKSIDTEWNRRLDMRPDDDFIGGVGWGVAFSDIIAVWSGPPAKPSEPTETQREMLRLQKEAIEEMKKQNKDGNEWKSDDE